MLSSTVPDRYIRPVIAFVIFASGLKYVGVGTTALGWTLVVVLLSGAAFILVQLRDSALIVTTSKDCDDPELVFAERSGCGRGEYRLRRVSAVDAWPR
jgi:hypothetical protein